MIIFHSNEKIEEKLNSRFKLDAGEYAEGENENFYLRIKIDEDTQDEDIEDREYIFVTPTGAYWSYVYLDDEYVIEEIFYSPDDKSYREGFALEANPIFK